MAKHKAQPDAIWCPVTKSRYVTAMLTLAVNHRQRDWSVEGRVALADDLDELATSERDPGPETITMAVDRLTKLALYMRTTESFNPHRVAASLAGCVQDEVADA